MHSTERYENVYVNILIENYFVQCCPNKWKSQLRERERERERGAL